ncbi:MAG: perosamine synthetase [Thermoleophilaceae bacterium]|nr:perosamine synthetase [Thermoleophilaceae bacterium]
MGETFLTCWTPLRPDAWVGSPARTLPFPLEEEGCRLYKFARQGLWHSLKALGLREGDAVLTPAYHHGSEVGVLHKAGIRCAYYEATESLAPDPDELESLLEPETRALYLIHNLGFPQDAPRWRSWCDERGLLLIEDVAMSWLAGLDGTPLGSWGDVAIFSPWKTYGLPDVGAAIARVPLPELDPTREVAASLIVRGHGKWVAEHLAWVADLATRDQPVSGFSAEIEFDTFDPEAAPSRLSIFMLRRLARGDAAAARRDNYSRLLEGLGDWAAPGFDHVTPEACPFVFPIETEHKDGLLRALAARQVRALNLWSIPHPTYPVGRFPAAARRRATTVGLPVHQELHPEDVDRMIEIVLSYGTGEEPTATRAREPRVPDTIELKEGDEAPDFELPDQDGRPVRLSDFAGRSVVLYFYPQADTPGCTAQACALRDRSPELSAAATTVLGVSPDRPDELKRFADKYGLPFPLLADERHEVAELYGVWVRRSRFTRRSGTQRTTYLIGPDRRIDRILRNVDPRAHDSLVLVEMAGR